MAFTADNIKFMYAQNVALLQTDKSGGSISASEIQAYVSGQDQLFRLGVLHTDVHQQYHKVFIKNDSVYDASGVKLWGINANDIVVGLAVEVGKDGNYVLNGDEQVKNMITEPRRYAKYYFSEYAEASYISLPDIPAGSSIGVWLEFKYGTLGTNNLEDHFTLGVEMTADSTTIQKTIDLYHSRIDGEVTIISMSKYRRMINGYVINIEMVDLSAIGIEEEDVIYALYVDKIKIKEHSGTDLIYASLYTSAVPFQVEIYVIPYKGYESTLHWIGICDLPVWDDTVNWDDTAIWVDEKIFQRFTNRLNVEFVAKNPEVYDVKRHALKWKKDSEVVYANLALIEADTGSGSGAYADIINKE